MKIYKNFEAVPSRILGVLGLLREAGQEGLSREALVALLQPTPLREKEDADNMSVKTLAALKELSSDGHLLIEEVEGKRGKGRVLLGEALRSASDAEFPNQMRCAVKRAAMRPLVGGAPNQFMDVLAWMCWLPPDAMPDDHSSFKTRFRASGLDLDEYGLGNDARWDNVVYWGRFIGLLWQRQRDACAGVAADATSLIREWMAELLPEEGRVPAQEFLSRLGALCPAIDGGSASARMAATLADRKLIGADFVSRVSPALSLALRALMNQGYLEYGCPDDQRTFLLLSGNEKVSFVSRKKVLP